MRVLFAATAAVLVFAAPAVAADRYVQSLGGTDASADCSAAMRCQTVQHAIDVATGGDRIVIGPGVFSGTPSTSKNLTFVGSGSHGGVQTVLRSTTAALTLTGGGTISHLRAEAPTAALHLSTTNAATPGIAYHLDHIALGADDSACSDCAGLLVAPDAAVPDRAMSVTVDDASVRTRGAGLRFDGVGVQGEVHHLSVDGSDLSSIGVDFTNGADGSIADATISGVDLGVWVRGGSGPAGGPERGQVSVARVRADVTGAGMQVYRSSVTVRDSLFVGTYGLLAQGFSGPNGANDVAVLRSTLAGGVAGVDVVSSGTAVSVSLTDSIALGLPGVPGATPYDLDANNALASIVATRSSFTTVHTTNGAGAPAAGSGSNVAGDPGFTDPGARDFTLLPSSPLIDRGDPGLVAAGDADAVGGTRSLDGNADCTAAPDLGAFERPAVACQLPGPDLTPPTLASVGFKPKTFRTRSARKPKHKLGSKLAATVSEDATLTVAVSRCIKGSYCRALKPVSLVATAGANSLRFRGKGLKPGAYRARVVAVDGAGNRSDAATARFRVASR